MEQTVSALQVFTAALVLVVLAAAFILGLWLRALVRQSALHPSVALRVIETIAVVIGGAIGSVAVLVLLVILWPERWLRLFGQIFRLSKWNVCRV
jgi:hypothetical protein